MNTANGRARMRTRWGGGSPFRSPGRAAGESADRAGTAKAGGNETAAKAAPVFGLLTAAAIGVFGMSLTGVDSVFPVAERATLPAHMTFAASDAASPASKADAMLASAGIPTQAVETPNVAAAVIARDLIAGFPMPRPPQADLMALPQLAATVSTQEPPQVLPQPRSRPLAAEAPLRPGTVAVTPAFGTSASLAMVGNDVKPTSHGAGPAATVRRLAATAPSAAPLLEPRGAIDRAPAQLFGFSVAQPGYALGPVETFDRAEVVPGPPRRAAFARAEISDLAPPDPAPAKPALALVAFSPVFKPVEDAVYRHSAVPTVAAVTAHFNSLEYDLAQVRTAAGPVPRLFLDALPRDLVHLSSVETKKSVFIRSVLPVILRVNEELATERARVERLRAELSWRGTITLADRAWLERLSARYEIAPFDWSALLEKLDVVPPSLALAQAAEESGWGTSRFAREGNALFGQYTYDAEIGMVPKRREAGRTHRVRAYENLLGTVRAYVHNLNSHPAYDGFRRHRAALRLGGGPIGGYELATQLIRYSERGKAYVRTIRKIIRYNRLGDFDRAQLHNRQWTAVDRLFAEKRS